jgi:putative membrane protein insertion efficiency factor
MARFVIWIIKAYQILLSPLLGNNCRFTPSCSHYSCQAMQKYGFLRGLWLTIARLLRCHPWHAGGHDPLP